MPDDYWENVPPCDLCGCVDCPDCFPGPAADGESETKPASAPETDAGEQTL